MMVSYSEKQELALDIVAVISILIRHGREDIADDKELFAEFLNQLGIKTISGREWTRMAYHNFMKRLPPHTKKAMKEEINKIEY